MSTQAVRPPTLLPLVLALGGFIVAFHVGNALVGKSFIRASHLGTALEYAHGPIHLLRPVIVGFNATGTPVAQEFPLWQAVAGLVFKLTNSTWYGWANFVSLVLFGTALWPFFQLARHYLGERAAWWATVFFLSEPLIVVMAGEAATDGFCLALSLWFLFFADKMIRTGKAAWWLPTVFFAVLGSVSKLPFFMAAGLCSIFMLMTRAESGVPPAGFGVSPANPQRLWMLLTGAGAVAAAAFAAWTHHTDFLASQAEYPYLDLRLSQSPFLVFWFFGDLHYRLTPGPWLKGGWRFLHATVGALPMIALLAPALLRRGNRLPKLWLVATFLTTLVFSHLVLAHWHYYLMCCPAVAMLCGATLVRFEKFWRQETSSTWMGLALAGVVLFFSTIDGMVAMKIAIDYDQFPKEISAVIREHTQPQDKLIIYTCDPDWGGEELFRSGRKGLSVMNLRSSPDNPKVKGLFDLLDSQPDLRRLKELGYNKLVLVSESPVRFAVEAANPGSKRQRRYFPPTISPTVDSWPVVFRSEDLLVKEIP